MEKIRTAIIKTPVGELLAGEKAGKLCLLDWRYRKMRESIDRRILSGLGGEYEPEECPLFDEVRRQLSEYFAGRRRNFDLPFLMVGTPFQKTVWEALLAVPYGKTETYGELAARAGHDKAVRAVASANGANALSIIIPCHRIIGAGGSTGGYAGGIAAKKRLIELESQMVFDI